MGTLQGKVAFITGAARGQGRSHALRLSAEGAKIIATDVCAPVGTVSYNTGTLDELEETKRLVEAAGGEIAIGAADVRDRDGLTRILDEGLTRFGHVDIVCANAGIAEVVPSSSMTDERWNEMIDINLSGAWRTVNVALPHMVKQATGGSVIFTGSVQSVRGMPGLSHYVASKHGIAGLTKSLGNELAEYNIRVNAVLPGNTRTPMMENETMMRVFVPGSDSPSKEEYGAASRSMMALPMDWIEPEDISNAVAFLASDQSRCITSSLLSVDAGMSQK
ncbi:mycofactocin-coupled SDR family oxidoreductase [Rhodococcus qingshengii]|uniref:mycofactocin-coupled SDR family oxidoreductase n=1 Tax=Rhodococcus qingshengii TaxID=334542 RepID=UPI0024B96432|nr:mycofactocin-coupled SDR family oxidoreductase [Rhodococcus qingshengii]MDJ0490923.1 mycofactocin-coupled SDR family oxidoreductase [Rhodococcus qingshengii]